jgi:hypothetical protein
MTLPPRRPESQTSQGKGWEQRGPIGTIRITPSSSSYHFLSDDELFIRPENMASIVRNDIHTPRGSSRTDGKSIMLRRDSSLGRKDNAHLFGLDQAVEERQTLKVLPGAKPHGMKIYITTNPSKNCPQQ